MIDQAARVAQLDECIRELSPEARTAVQLWLMAICREMGDRARLRGQRPQFGEASAKELLYVAIEKGWLAI